MIISRLSVLQYLEESTIAGGASHQLKLKSPRLQEFSSSCWQATCDGKGAACLWRIVVLMPRFRRGSETQRQLSKTRFAACLLVRTKSRDKQSKPCQRRESARDGLRLCMISRHHEFRPEGDEYEWPRCVSKLSKHYYWAICLSYSLARQPLKPSSRQARFQSVGHYSFLVRVPGHEDQCLQARS